MPIIENEVYTSEETQQLLKISPSTFKRLIKKGVIRAAKIGGQYRILGAHLLHLFNPVVEERVRGVYRKTRNKIREWEVSE